MMRSPPLIIQELFGLQGHSIQHILLLKKRNDSFGNNLLNIRSKWLDPIYNHKGEAGGKMCATKKSLWQNSENAWLSLYNCTIVTRHPSYNVLTTAGASSMTVDSAATLVDCQLNLSVLGFVWSPHRLLCSMTWQSFWACLPNNMSAKNLSNCT